MSVAGSLTSSAWSLDAAVAGYGLLMASMTAAAPAWGLPGRWMASTVATLVIAGVQVAGFIWAGARHSPITQPART
ncbi:hypothetical protein [Streptosporangium sp. NPDC003464]